MSKIMPIAVRVETDFLREHSDPQQQRFAFSYTITIVNQSEQPARLLTRHWIITDANGHVQEVHGEGVVGEQPTIAPGNSYQYSSGAIIPTPVGSMQGSYTMLRPDGHHFDAPIAPFRLAVPEFVN